MFFLKLATAAASVASVTVAQSSFCVSRYELNGRCSNNVSCSMERAISGYIEPVKWWYQLIDDDNDAFYVQ
jgi:hypothetical protein